MMTRLGRRHLIHSARYVALFFDRFVPHIAYDYTWLPQEWLVKEVFLIAQAIHSLVFSVSS